MTQVKEKRPAAAVAMSFAYAQELMPWDQISEELFRRTGKRISGTRCWQICQRAEEKLRAALRGDAEDR